MNWCTQRALACDADGKDPAHEAVLLCISSPLRGLVNCLAVDCPLCTHKRACVDICTVSRLGIDFVGDFCAIDPSVLRRVSQYKPHRAPRSGTAMPCSATTGMRPPIILFGDSITQQAFKGGWGSELSDLYIRKAGQRSPWYGLQQSATAVVVRPRGSCTHNAAFKIMVIADVLNRGLSGYNTAWGLLAMSKVRHHHVVSCWSFATFQALVIQQNRLKTFIRLNFLAVLHATCSHATSCADHY